MLTLLYIFAHINSKVISQQRASLAGIGSHFLGLIGPLHGHKVHIVHSSMAIFLEDIQNTDTVLSNRKIMVS